MSGIAIRPLAATDAQALLATVHASLPTLSRWLPWASADYGLADAEAWVAHTVREREAEREYHFGIFDADETLVGGVGLNHRIPAYRSAHLGYWVADAVRGRGVAAEAARAALRYGFDTLGLQRIAIMTPPEHLASQRVAAKLGATYEGRARNGIAFRGDARDALVFSLIPSDMGLGA
jgi:ribosomal-protein-serine acetyltransferase